MRKVKENQLRRVYIAFYKGAKTRLQVAIETDIRISSICRHVDRLKRNSQIKIVYIGICPISKWSGVEFLTTNLE